MGLNRALGTSAMLVLAWAFTTGCTVDAASTTPCSVDAQVACTGDSVGYSCDGTATPQQNDSTLNCGDGVTEADGQTGFCCGALVSGSGCAVDSTIPCTDGSSGYSCTGAETPTDSDPTQSCGAGVSDNNGNTNFCCITTTTSSCSADATVAGCSGGSYGFSCTSTDTPTDGNSALNCSDPTTGPDGASLYCCFTPGTSSCMLDSTVAGCSGDSFGFSCTSTDTPDQTDASLTCSDPTAGPDGEMLYCCTN